MCLERRRMATPIAPKPTNIMLQAAGSGTGSSSVSGFGAGAGEPAGSCTAAVLASDGAGAAAPPLAALGRRVMPAVEDAPRARGDSEPARRQPGEGRHHRRASRPAARAISFCARVCATGRDVLIPVWLPRTSPPSPSAGFRPVRTSRILRVNFRQVQRLLHRAADAHQAPQ